MPVKPDRGLVHLIGTVAPELVEGITCPAAPERPHPRCLNRPIAVSEDFTTIQGSPKTWTRFGGIVRLKPTAQRPNRFPEFPMRAIADFVGTTRGVAPVTAEAFAPLLIAACILLTGCGGGSGTPGTPVATGASGGGTDPGAGESTVDAGGTGTVHLRVTDEFDEPVGLAKFTVNSRTPSAGYGFSGVVDASGQIAVSQVPAGEVWAAAGDDAIGLFGRSGEAQLRPNHQIDLEVIARPASETPSIGVGPSSVTTNGIQANGSSLEFDLRVFYVAGNIWHERLFIGTPELRLAPCLPDLTNDVPTHIADCISGDSPVDVEYRVANGGRPLTVTVSHASHLAPFSVALLLDQSRNIAVSDPWHARLHAARYFLDTKSRTGSLALAAFAADDDASGEITLLPQQPVTTFPVEDPGFTPAGNDLFATLDSLADLEGGAAPLYQAIDRMLDFTAAHAPAAERRAVIVLTDGRDDVCGTPEVCLGARSALIEKSRETGIEIVTIGLMTPTGDSRVLSGLADSTGGIALWAKDPGQLSLIFSALGAILDGSAEMHTLRFRIESPVLNAFRSGHTVFGTLELEFCPWLCYHMSVPIVVPIP
jgi:hypothetical protein